MIFVLKTIFVILLVAIGAIGYFYYRIFIESIKSDDYENVTLFGKLINKLLFIGINASLLTFAVFLIYLLFAKITIG